MSGMKKFSELVREKRFEELTFEKFLNEQKTENNIEKLWEEYENLKFDHGELFNKFLGYNEYQRLVYIEENDMKDVSEKIYNDSNGILYHITSENNVEKILKYGLEPRSENKKGWHPKRIYFCDFNSDTEKLKNFGEILNNDKYCVLKIDLKKQPRYKIKFFEDPQTDLVKAYYTCESIPPMCISKVDNIKLDKLLVNIDEISNTIKSKILNFTSKFLHF